MINKKSFSSIFLCFLFVVSCSSDKEEPILNTTLSSELDGREAVLGNVIACAASNEDPSVVSIFLYPRENVSNISFYETTSVEVDENNFSQYTKGDSELIDVFNGYLLKYEVSSTHEKWVIVSFEEDGKIHLSNPIRLKQNSKPTEYLPQNVGIDNMENMPIFSWEDGAFDDTVIYFQVISDENGELLSGTYTIEQMFQYYKLENVVLNITLETPPLLESGQPYNFSLLAVSEDNWVNLFVETEFILN